MTVSHYGRYLSSMSMSGTANESARAAVRDQRKCERCGCFVSGRRFCAPCSDEVKQIRDRERRRRKRVEAQNGG